MHHNIETYSFRFDLPPGQQNELMNCSRSRKNQFLRPLTLCKASIEAHTVIHVFRDLLSAGCVGGIHSPTSTQYPHI